MKRYLGRELELHYVRTKDGAEVDFAVSEDGALTHLIECKATDDRVRPALARFVRGFPEATAVQLVGQLRHAQSRQGVVVTGAATWLAELSA